MQDAALPIAGLWRRLGALVYDALLILAVLMIATVPFLPLLHGRVLVPREAGALAYVYWGWQLVVIVLFFGYFWTRRGQTVGMLAWRVRLERRDGSLLSWADAVTRIAVILALFLPFLAGYPLLWGRWTGSARLVAMYVTLALPIVAYLSIWFDRNHLALYDRWTNTRMVVLPKR